MTTITTTTTTSPLSTNPVLPPQDAASNRDPSSASQSSAEDYNAQIDALLTRYLHLLNEYTTLRSSLSSLQAGMYQNLARANFAAERGVRYGKEYFDERMVASRRVVVRVGAKGGLPGDEGRDGEKKEEGGLQGVTEGVTEFRVVKVDEEGNEAVQEKDVGGKKNEKDDGREGNAEQSGGNEAEEQDQDKQDTTNPTDRQKEEDTSPEKDDGNEDTDTPEDKNNKIKKMRKNDPLRWFGLLTPLPLRLAQSQAIQAVEQIIPRLVTVNAEMAQVEIEVRRARKRREKAAVKTKAAAEGGGKGDD